MVGQPRDQPLHVIDPLGLRSTILSAPALDLARHIILATTEISEAKRRWIEAVQLRQRRTERAIDGGPLGGSRIGNIGLPEDAALDIIHQIERRADNAGVVAIVQGLRDRKTLRGQRGDYPEFAID